MYNSKIELILLSQSFYNDFPQNKFPEILTKKDRPYMLFLLTIEGQTFGIPFKSNIRHNFSYITGEVFNSSLQKKERRGLDYTKAIIITKREYIDAKRPIFNDPKEKTAIFGKEHLILKGFKKFFNNYCSIVKREVKNMPTAYKFSTLQYFHKELGLNC